MPMNEIMQGQPIDGLCLDGDDYRGRLFYQEAEMTDEPRATPNDKYHALCEQWAQVNGDLYRARREVPVSWQSVNWLMEKKALLERQMRALAGHHPDDEDAPSF